MRRPSPLLAEVEHWADRSWFVLLALGFLSAAAVSGLVAWVLW